MSIVVASMPSPHQLPLSTAADPKPVASSPTTGYLPPSTPSEQAFADGHKASPSKREPRDEIRGAYRAQSIRSIREAEGDVNAFLEELDVKRKQLDEQIHRYIKQKDREFRLFERDQRIKYRNAGTARSRPSAGAAPARTDPPTRPSNAPDRGPAHAQSQPRVDDNGLVNRKVTREREKDLLGVFTPNFLPLLSRVANADLATSSSAPTPAPPLKGLEPPSHRALHRANSDPVDDKDLPPPTRAKLEKRTSSSGSESRNLVSVLKSPATSRHPKGKRVSIVVGDEVVAPSDSVPALAPAANQGHFRSGEAAHGDGEAGDDQSARHTLASVDKADGVGLDDDTALTFEDQHAGEASDVIPRTRATPPPARRIMTSDLAAGLAISRLASLKSAPSAVNKEKPPPPPAGIDVFDFSDSELAASEPRDCLNVEPDEASDVSPISTPVPTNERGPPRRLEIPTRPRPMLRSASSSAPQPVSPGFSRPSVNDDPHTDFGNDGLRTPEIEDNATLGSLTPSHSLLDRTGSLGESYMERNAEELRKSGKRRRSASSQHSTTS